MVEFCPDCSNLLHGKNIEGKRYYYCKCGYKRVLDSKSTPNILNFQPNLEKKEYQQHRQPQTLYINVPFQVWRSFMTEMKEGYKNLDNHSTSYKDKAWAWGVYKRQREIFLELSKVFKKYANKYKEFMEYFKQFENKKSVVVPSNHANKILEIESQIELYTLYMERAELYFIERKFKQGIRELQRIDGQISKPVQKRKLLFGDYKFSSTLSESPIEDKFWVNAKDKIPGLKQQYKIGSYRTDFAILDKKIVIECDGQYYHNPISDLVRDEILKEEGWETIRFTGNQINYNIRSCIEQVLKLIKNK